MNTSLVRNPPIKSRTSEYGVINHSTNITEETPDFDSVERDASLSGAQSFHVLKRMPWLNTVMMAMPSWISVALNPALESYMRQKKRTTEKVKQLASTTEDDWLGKTVPVFRGAMDSPKLPTQEKQVGRLAQDAQMLLMAGTLTMASTLEHMLYWMVDNPEVLSRLKEELRTVMPSVEDASQVSLAALEGLPYLTAVIKECVRLIYGNSTPHFRVNPDGPLTYRDGKTGKEWVIPKGTPVGMTSVLLHHNEENFPDSYRFVPERWIGEDAKKLDKYMVSFGKGSRICLGMPQSYGIMRVVLARLWRTWASPEARIGDELGVLRLYNTSREDVQVAGDFFIAAYNKRQGVEFKLQSM